jgi:hypothetical protein
MQYTHYPLLLCYLWQANIVLAQLGLSVIEEGINCLPDTLAASTVPSLLSQTVTCMKPQSVLRYFLSSLNTYRWRQYVQTDVAHSDSIWLDTLLVGGAAVVMKRFLISC